MQKESQKLHFGLREPGKLINLLAAGFIAIFVLLLCCPDPVIGGVFPDCHRTCQSGDIDEITEVSISQENGDYGVNLELHSTTNSARYCIRVTGDWYVGGNLVKQDWFSEPVNTEREGDISGYHSFGSDSLGTVELEGGGPVHLRNVIVYWANKDNGCTASCDIYPPANCSDDIKIDDIQIDTSITVRKETDPSDPDPDFEFTIKGQQSNYEDGFFLSHNQDKTYENLLPGSYTITEYPPDLWYLDDISGDGSPDFSQNEVTIDLADGQNLETTFINKRLGISVSGNPKLRITQTQQESSFSDEGVFALRYDGDEGIFEPDIEVEVPEGDGDYRVGATYYSEDENSNNLLSLVENGAETNLHYYNPYDETDKPSYENVAQLGELDGNEETFTLKIDLSKLAGSYSSTDELDFEISFWLYPPED